MRSLLNRTLRPDIDGLKKSGTYRTLKTIAGPVDTTVFIDGKEVLLLSSNNYLGLTNHPRLKEAATFAVRDYGTGACASRLIAGNLAIHEDLEKRIASFKGSRAAVVFSTGYMANIGLITSIAGENDLIVSDELNHASIVDGCMLSKAEVKVYPHKNVEELKRLLSQGRSASAQATYRRRIIVTDGVFSMDGDIAPLPEILEVAEEHHSVVVVDDAHATGVLGENGKGTLEHFGLENENIIQIGTFSKALGSLGGYAAGPDVIVEYLKNKARGFIYSTALPPSVCAASIAALDIVEAEPWIRRRLWENVSRLKRGLTALGYDIRATQTQIIPVVIGDTSLTMEFAEAIFEEGIYAPGIRPPTVQEGKSRIRVTPMASHTDEQIDKALAVFESVGGRLGII